MTYFYRIADVPVQFLTDCPLVENRDTLLFRCDEEARDAVSFSVASVPSISVPSGMKLCDSFPDVEMYLSDATYTRIVRHRETGALFLSAERQIGVPDCTVHVLESGKPYTVRTQALWSAVDLPYALLLRNVLTIHASVIRVGDGVILFTAPSQTGKSTQAALWYTHRGAQILNGDKAALSVRDDGVWAHGLPFCGTSGICERYALPVRRIVVLRQAAENRVSPLRGVQALRALCANSFGNPSLCSSETIRLAAKILETVPVSELSCTPDERAVIALEKSF